MAPPRKGDLNDVEQKLIDAVTKGNIEDVKILLKENNVKIDFLDESGMTLLQHAAFRGKSELCEMFLARGADVNSNYHENGYTALMFAALSGNTEVTKMMLTAGAKIDHVNSVGRTAAQMAGFVGQHQCVSVINSFFPKEKLLHFTKPQGLEKEGKLTTETANAMLKMMNMANLHPVKLSYILQDNICLLENTLNVIRVLELLCEKYMKARDTNDVMAMKTHYFSVLIKHASKVYKDKESLDPWIKSLLKQREDGCEENQEKLIRQCLREFPYGDSQLFQQMVGNLARVKIGDEPTGLSILSQGINGQKFTFDLESPCGTCGESKAEKKCSACKMVNYCNARCQKLHWSVHKKHCKSLAEEYRIEQENKKREEEKQRKEREKKEQQQIQKKLEAANLQNDEVTQKIIAALKEKKLKEEKLKNIPKVSLDTTTPTEVVHKDVEKINVMSSDKVVMPVEKMQLNDFEVKPEKPKIAEKPKILIEKTRSSEQAAPKACDKPKLMTEKPKIAAKPKMPGNKPKLAEKPRLPSNKPKLLTEKPKSNKLKLSIGKTKPHGAKSPEKIKSPPIQIKPILKKSLPKQDKVTEIPADLSYEIKDRPMQRLPPDGIDNEECQQIVKVKSDNRQVGHLQESKMLTRQAAVTTDEAKGVTENTIKPKQPEKMELKEIKSVEAEPEIKLNEKDKTKKEAKESENIRTSVKSDEEVDKPLFVSSLTDQEVEEGQELKFEVVYSGTPTPSIAWYLDDEEIKQNPEVRIVTKGGLSMLLIRECIPEDEGEYTVEVTNKNGCVSASAFVAVLENERKKKRKSRKDPICSAAQYSKHNMVSSPIEPIIGEEDLWARETVYLEDRRLDLAVESKHSHEENKSEWKKGKKDIGALILSRFESITEEPEGETDLDKDVVLDTDNLENTFDTPVVPNDTPVVPNDTAVVPNNTAVVPNDNTVVPNNATVVPNDTTVVPNNTTVVQNNSTLVPNDTTVVPNDTTVVPNNTTVVPNDTTVVPNNTTVVPNDTTLVPNDATVVPNDTTVVPSNTTVVPNNTTVVPNDTPVVPSDTTVVPNQTDSLKDPLNKNENKAVVEIKMSKTKVEKSILEQNQCIPSGDTMQEGEKEGTVDQPSAKFADHLETGIQNDVGLKQSSLDIVKELQIEDGQQVLEHEVPVVVTEIASEKKLNESLQRSFEEHLDHGSERKMSSNICEDALPKLEQKSVDDDAQSLMVLKDLPVEGKKEVSRASVKDAPLSNIGESKISQKEILKESSEYKVHEAIKDAPEMKENDLSTNVLNSDNKSVELKTPSKEAPQITAPSNLIKSKWQEIEKKVIKSKSQNLKKTVPQKPQKDVKEEVIKKDPPKEVDKNSLQLGIKHELSENFKAVQKEENATAQRGVKDVVLKSQKDSSKGIEKKMPSKITKDETEEPSRKVFMKSVNDVSKENGKKAALLKSVKELPGQSPKKTLSKDVPKEIEKKPASKKITEETEKKPFSKSPKAIHVPSKVSKDVVVKFSKDASKESEKKTSPKSLRASLPKQSKNVSEPEKKSPPKDHNGVKSVADVSAEQDNKAFNSVEKTSQGLLAKRFPQGVSTKKTQEPVESRQAYHKDIKKDVGKKPIPGILAKKFPQGFASKSSKEVSESISKGQTEDTKQEKVEKTSGLFSKQSSTISISKKVEEPVGKVDKKVSQEVTSKTTERLEESKQPAAKNNGTNLKPKDVPSQQQKNKQDLVTKKPLALDKKPSPNEAKETAPGKKKLPGILANKFPFLAQKSQEVDKRAALKRTTQELTKKKSVKTEISESTKAVKDTFPTVVQKASQQLLKEKQQQFQKDTAPQTVGNKTSSSEQLCSSEKDKSKQKFGADLKSVQKDTEVTDVPLSVSPLSDIKAKKGSSVKFEVTFAGVPTPTVTWSLDGDTISNMDGIKVTTKDGLSSVMIGECISDDEGDYCVEIENKNGKVSTTAFLGVA